MSARDIEDLYPLTPLQAGLVFHTLAAPAAGTYVVQLTGRLAGLEPGAFRAAWEQLLARHPILRTAVVAVGSGRYLQLVQRTVALPLQEEDWQALTPAEQDQRLAAYLAADRRRGFALDQAPLLRLALFHRGPTDCQLVFSFHHLLLDGWSVARLWQELRANYAAHRAGRPRPLPPAPAYRDYLGWLAQQDQAAAEQYWRRVLAGFTSPTPLGVDRAAAPTEPPDANPATATEQWGQLDPPATERLRAWAQSQQLTLNTVVQGAWALLLSRYSGQTDVVFGATVAGRPPGLAGGEALLGLCINTLPVRVRAEPGARLGDWLRALQAAQADARQYEHSPLVAVQGWSDVPRGQPLFETLVVFENYPTPTEPGDPDGLRLEQGRTIERTHYPLTLVAVPDAAGLTLKLLYDPGRLRASTTARLVGHLAQLLAEMAGDPARPLWQVGLLPPAERRQLLAAWSGTRTPYPHDRCVHELFAAQVALQPDAIALVAGTETLTYRALDARANRLAHRLQREYGVGPEVPVGVCLERSAELVVALLAVLKAGGAYVPLDPAYPPERLAFLARDAGLALVITQPGLRDRLPTGFAVLELDGHPAEESEPDPGPPVSAVGPDHLAYIIYTSGSTGTPKGVMVSHANVTSLFAAAGPFRFSAADVWTLFHSVTFDFSVWELFGALVHGGRLVVVPYLVSRSPEEFRALLVQERVTVLNQTPSACEGLVQTKGGSAGADLALRLTILGGEALSATLVERWRAQQGEEPPGLVNGYGPTECTIFTTFQYASDYSSDTPATANPVPIGRPPANRDVYVLDAALQPVPVGVAGELYIGGAGLARGYLGRPGLTAERFVPHPWSPDPGARLYRSGDRVRWREDGSLEFLGRMDQQVKLRGFRIEPGEIEAALRGQPGVVEAVVVLREDAPGERRLVAYVVARAPAPAGAELRRFLGQRLPDYMIPSVFVFLDALPLTPHGKVDRQALPLPDPERRERAGDYRAPRTPTEVTLARVWSEVLGVERVGIHDNFFDLGAQSLLLVRAHGMLREVLTSELALVDLFRFPTIAALADHVDQADDGHRIIEQAQDRAQRRRGVIDRRPPRDRA